MGKETKVLIVDDEESIINFLTMGLESEGFIVYSAEDGLSGVNMAKEVKPHIIILDLMMPKLDGYQACEEIKKIMDVPIIMLTAREDVNDKVKGLDMGADDYMVKPFSYRELVARINARLRNMDKTNKVCENVNISNFVMNEDAFEIRFKGDLLELSPTEYKLLKFLLDNKGIVLSKMKILDNVWGYDFYGDENVVEVYIRYLRNKLNDKEHKIIQTVRGAGYKINVEK